MKKQILLLFILLLLPFRVNAETCNKNDIKIDSITVKDKSNNVQEKEKTTINQNKINMNLDMKEVGDFIEYEIVVKNDSKEDYYLNNNSLVSNSNYIEYSIKPKDNSNTIKAKSSKTFYVKVSYKTTVDKTAYQDGNFVDNNEFVLPISNSENINPSTGVNIIFISICVLIVLISLSSLSKRSELILILALLLIPTGVLAICKTDIVIESTINIKKKNYNPCTYEGEMTTGAEFHHGLYTYHYKEEAFNGEGVSWNPIEEDGWGMILYIPLFSIDQFDFPDEYYDLSEEELYPKILEDYPVCSSINGKPIVSMQNAFNELNIDYIDLETLDTSQVVDMTGMFIGSTATVLDFSVLDTSNVKNMGGLFQSSKINNIIINNDTSKLESISGMFSYLETDSLDLSRFDTHNVTDFNSLFAGIKIKTQTIDLSPLDTHNATNMSGMFYSTDLTELDVSTLDTSKVTDMCSMFDNLKLESEIVGLDHFDTHNVTTMKGMFQMVKIPALNLQSFNTEKVTDMSYMFWDADVPEINLSSFDTSSVETMSWMFTGTTASSIDVSSFNTSNVTNMSRMFFTTRNLTTIDLSSFDMSNVTNTNYMFESTSATTGYARTQEDADILNAIDKKPDTLIFVVK